jgi:transposase InsO family protein
VVQVQQTLQVSERRACRVLKHCRATHQYVVQQPDDEAPLRTRIIELARAYGRYGYRRITALLHREGWAVNHNNPSERASGWRTVPAFGNGRSIGTMSGPMTS